MKVKILKASLAYWYANKIGEVLEVEEFDEHNYLFFPCYYIAKDDCEIIEEPTIAEHPTHYKVMKIEPLEFIKANDLNFCEGNIIKYVCRYKKKNGKEDLLKAKSYLDELIKEYDRAGS